MKGILGKKIGMTEVFAKNGKLIPVTVVEVEPNVVMQVKTMETDGYEAIQLGVVSKNEKHSTKPESGHAKKANTAPKRFLKEIKNFEGDYKVGDVLKSDVFNEGDYVDVTGTSKGKGFQGVIKRHNFSMGPRSHGSHHHRKPGSLGSVRAKKVFKGTKLPGHMGSETVTIQNLEVIETNPEENYILISGNVPGPKGSYVLIKEAIKKDKASEVKEILIYDEIEEIIEKPTEVVEEVIEETQEVVEETKTIEETPEKVEETEAVEEVVEQVEPEQKEDK